MRYVIFLVGLGIFVASEALAQQIPDLSFLPEIENPAYPSGKGPVVMVDEAHFNFHTTEGRYKPFAELLRRDGYIVKSLRSTFNSESLNTCQILVIANALSERNQSNWSLPTFSAFSDEEIAIVRDWVRNGGSLLLIADHMPFPGTAADLASAFGIRFNNGFAFETQQQERITEPMVFRRSDGSLANHPITNGRMDNERVDSVATFTGQAFQSDVDVQPLLIFRSSAISLMPTAAWSFTSDTPRIPVEGWFQAVVMHFGKGRAAFFGEAAMFSAQLAGSKRRPMGMNAPVAAQNPQFLLNVLHWLCGPLEDRSGPEKKPAKSLHHAALLGHIDQVQLLISSGFDVNAKDKLNQTPLHWAAITGKRKVAELLLTKGADVNAKHRAGDTALHVAASRGHKGMAQLFIAKGADVNSKNNDGQTPVVAAMAQNRRNIIELLVARGADISNIHLAAYLGDADKVKSFLDEGADVNEESESGYTPLHYAAMENSKDVAELLLAKGAGVNAKNKYGATPLHEAVRKGYKDLAELLIASGADVNARDSSGVTTPLNYAAYLGHKDIAELLITKGADVNAKDNTSRTPLRWAKKRGHKEIVKLLRKHGAKK